MRAVAGDLEQRGLQVGRVRLVLEGGRPVAHHPLDLFKAPFLHVREAGVEFNRTRSGPKRLSAGVLEGVIFRNLCLNWSRFGSSSPRAQRGG